MTVEEIMQYRRANPFQPFVLQLKDGRKFVIRAPEHIGRDEQYSRVMFAADNDSCDEVGIEDIAGIKLLPKQRAPRGRKGHEQ